MDDCITASLSSQPSVLDKRLELVSLFQKTELPFIEILDRSSGFANCLNSVGLENARQIELHTTIFP